MILDIPLYRLQCGANSYGWGKKGSESKVAEFAAATSFKIQEDKPYAELWMGTHPSNPSYEVTTNRTLLDFIQTNQALISPSIAATYGLKLPFLFKVLSIGKALSIQAHPDKKLAERLHKEDPKNYPDDNHKPEMAVAISEFDGFCGFRPLGEIISFLKTIPALEEIVGEEATKKFITAVEGRENAADEATVNANKAALKNLYEALMTSSQEKVREKSRKLVESAKADYINFGGGSPLGGKELAELVIRLNEQFPDDIGLFNTLVLNYIKLQPGEAIYLKANDPHAYLSGDIVECMASSDNVVRAGFTPKFKDVEVLVSMLTYSYAPISEQKMKPEPFPGTKHSILYDPPIDEFAVIKTQLKSGEKEVFRGIEGPSIVIATQGRGRIRVAHREEELKKGYVFFVGATAELVVENDSQDEEEQLVFFRAYCELKGHPATV